MLVKENIDICGGYAVYAVRPLGPYLDLRSSGRTRGAHGVGAMHFEERRALKASIWVSKEEEEK